MAKETPGIDRLDHGGEESKNPTKRVGRERPSIEKRTYTSPVGKPSPKAGKEFVHEPPTNARGRVVDLGEEITRADSVREV